MNYKRKFVCFQSNHSNAYEGKKHEIIVKGKREYRKRKF